MAVNYAEKYSPLVDERFSAASITEAAFNQDYDWEGVSTVNVYSVATSPMNDYQISGMQRYGVPDELGTSTQTMTLTQDKSFTFTIDRRNYTDQMMVTESGRALRRQVDEEIIPMVDIYRLAALTAGAGNTTTKAITEDNAYEAFITGVATVLGNKAPRAGMFAYISPDFYVKIRLDGHFIKQGDISQEMLNLGEVGRIDGVPLIEAPFGYLPEGVDFIITNRIAAVSPVKIAEYKVNDNPQGISGWLAEGRTYFDAFVLDNKANAIYVHMEPEPEPEP